jgi:hypothetical protein
MYFRNFKLIAFVFHIRLIHGFVNVIKNYFIMDLYREVI